ncbi:hypothetical protein ACM614_02015 [Streptomyces sp. 12297]|uniref:hypothetical protein n=1 Tax=Streptomyces sp. NBC_00239 TaxID=2903640 RepID=UPI002E2A4F1E|nr:hypothetical protein [Streptomyces sp. NBC_00239]
MRMRNAVTAAVGALVIAAALSGPASAAEGTFTYLYPGGADDVAVAIENPADERCYNFEKLPEGQLPVMVANDTTMIALVYAGENCTGEAVELAPGDSQDDDALVAKSVVFVMEAPVSEPAGPAKPAQPAQPAEPVDEAQPGQEAENGLEAEDGQEAEEGQEAEDGQGAHDSQDSQEAQGSQDAQEGREDEAEAEVLPADGDRAAVPAAADVDGFVQDFVRAWG